MIPLNRFRSSRDWWLISPDTASETSAKVLHFKGEPNRGVDGPENLHTVSIGYRSRVVAITTYMQQTYLSFLFEPFGIQTCRFTVNLWGPRNGWLVTSQLLKPCSDKCMAMQNFGLNKKLFKTKKFFLLIYNAELSVTLTMIYSLLH